MYIPLGIAPVNLTAILILTPPLRSHPSIPVRTAKIESHAGMIDQNIIYMQHVTNHRGNNTHSKGRPGSSNRKGYQKGNGNSNVSGYGQEKNNNSKQGNGYQNNKQGFKLKNYCSLCGFKDHLATDGCPNVQDDMGKIIHVHPCQTTFPNCPSTIHPCLNHSATNCPFFNLRTPTGY
jgi:hypothetical protein